MEVEAGGLSYDKLETHIFDMTVRSCLLLVINRYKHYNEPHVFPLSLAHIYWKIHVHTGSHAWTCYLSGGLGDACPTVLQHLSQLLVIVMFNLVEPQLTVMNETHQN